MEIAPRYLETPETIKRIFVSTSGGNARGSAVTNAVAGTVAAGRRDRDGGGRRGLDRRGARRRELGDLRRQH
jgi:hypothetical protein